MSPTSVTHPEPQFPAATFHDALAVVEIVDAGVLAIIAKTAARGLEGGAWDAEALHLRSPESSQMHCAEFPSGEHRAK